MPTNSESFLYLPEVQRLADIARSSNTLIALSVERREVSWTQFMAWLLDPARVGPGTSADRLGWLIGRGVDAVHEVQAEHSLGKAGRVDLLVRCQVAGRDLAVLIENKIDATESEDQLCGYAQAVSGEVLPVFIELGDEPVRECSSVDAVCMDRADISAWLRVCGPLPDPGPDYLTLFEAWDISKRLRREHPAEIDAIAGMEHPPTIWHLVQHWLMANETPFYQEAMQCPVLVEAMATHGFSEPESMGRLKAEHEILVLAKPSWAIYPCDENEPGVQVHFECDGRGRLRMDVGIYPYEGSIMARPDRLVALDVQLKLKAKMQEQVREMLHNIQMPAGIEIDQRGLRSAQSPAANSAGRFVREIDGDCTPEEYAGFIAQVSEAVTPAVDSLLQERHADKAH